MKEHESRILGDRGPSLTGPAIVDPKLLFSSQLTILKRVLFRIYEIAGEEAAKELEEPKEYRQLQQHPHQVFLIDGARGSGKTTLLLTILHNLKYLGRPQRWKPGIPSSSLFDDDKRRGTQNAHSIPGGARRTAFYLPILFPSDLEAGQSIMEGLIALLVASIEEIKQHKKDSSDFERWRKEADGYIKRANEKVAQGWFLSKDAGTDAILRDSADYKDYLKKRGEANVASFGRVAVWREFVNDYLDFFQSELLVVFFDDTDVALETTRDILHTMRIFLDHPRIVTVIAANLRAMRQSVLLDGMGELSVPMEALGTAARSTARDWRRFVRRQIEEYLEKILPRPYRQYIQVDQSASKVRRTSSPRDAEPSSARRTFEEDAPTQADRDFKLIFREVDTFDHLCGKMLNKYRDEFLAMKHRANFRSLDDCQEIADDDERAKLENYISWWTLRHWYADALRPRSARHMMALRAFIGDYLNPGAIDEFKYGGQRKRLAVILFESPDNYELIQRFGDDDKLVLQWLWRQKIHSAWYDQRYIEIDDRRVHEKTYSYQYLFYRIDLGIALPVHENPVETPPRGFLPEPDGPNLVGFRRFFPGISRSRLFGVARDLHHTLIPANCVYLADLDALPDIAWKSSTDGRDHWGRDINYKWADYFFFDVDELRHKDHPDGSAAAVPTDATVDKRSVKDARVEDEWIKGYFLDTVLPLASIFVGQFVQPSPGRKEGWGLQRAVESSLLAAELHPDGQFFAGACQKIDSIRRRFHYAETLGTTLKDGKSANELAWRVLRQLDKEVLQPLFAAPQRAGSRPEMDELSRLSGHLVDYRWIVNDVRCAWHAARIFLSQISETLKKRSSRTGKDDHIAPDTSEVTRRDNFFRGDRYTIATRQAFDRWLTRSDTLESFLKMVEGAHHQTEDGVGADISEEDIGVSRDGFYSVKDDSWLRGRVWSDIKSIIDYSRPVEYGWPSSSSDERMHALSPAELELFLAARTDLTKRNRTWPLILDPGLHDELAPKAGENRQELKQRAHDARTNERLGRSLLLFFYGISPTLPALIHVEIAATLKHRGNDIERTKEILKDWERRIKRHLLFVQRYRRVLEVTKVRLDLMMLWKQRYDAGELNARTISDLLPPTASNFGVRATLAPDMSYSSLGIRGIRLFPNFFSGGDDDGLRELAEDLRKTQNRWDAVDKKTGRVRWRSLIDITIEHLVEALNFVATATAVLDSAGGSTRPIKPVT